LDILSIGHKPETPPPSFMKCKQVASHAHIVQPRDVALFTPVANPIAWKITLRLSRLVQNFWNRFRVEIEDFPQLDGPVLFTMNHSHYYDFLWSRAAMDHQEGVRTVSFVKYRAFQNRLTGTYMRRMGNIPIISRGYLISADFAQVHGRKLSEAEYRVLRDHVNGAGPLPDEPVFQALLTGPREVFGISFEPDTMQYREIIGACYSDAMATTLSQARKILAVGHSLHIYPEGLYSTRLSQGRTGVIQIAAELGLPIVPVGFSGMNDLFHDKCIRAHKSGTLKLRFGTPFRLERPELENFTPFDFREEERLAPVLEEETHKLMGKINDLLDPSCQWGEDLVGDGVKGIARFFI
jgi:1-acyl-sn-glycerol-3-phosphate acyltransferase